MTTTFITILLSNSYLPGALVLSNQLTRLHPTIPKVILISTAISGEAKKLLARNFDELIELKELIETSNVEDLELFGRLDLRFTLSKVYLFNLIQFDSLIYFDADVLPLKPLGETILNLKVGESTVAGSPDASWPDIFNSGFLILKPSAKTFESLISNLDQSFDGADQGLFNQYFKIWTRLPFLYNVTVNYGVNVYEYLPALNHFKDQIVNVHFIGIRKPWLDRDVSNDSTGFFKTWWDVFNKSFTDIAGEIFDASGAIDKPILIEQKASFLSRGPEAQSFNETKIANKWDTEEEAIEPIPDPLYPPAIFPWEQNRVKPTRVFGPDSEYLEPAVLDKLDRLDIVDQEDE